MIARQVAMRSVRKSDFGELVRYITDTQGSTERVGAVVVTNCASDNPVDAAIEVRLTQQENTRSGADKTYHLIVSFRAGEEPSNEVLRAVEQRLCEGLGFGEHQRVSAAHYDTDNIHLHVAINKVHPTRRTIHAPYNDHKTFGPLCEALEKEYGLQADNHAVQKRGAESRAAGMEHHAGLESLIGWVRRECLDRIHTTSSWAELHDTLREHGLELRERGNGFIFTDGSGTQAKASSIARSLSRAQLEKRLGPFEPSPHPPITPQGPPRARYAKKPLRSKIDTSALYARYQLEQRGASAARTAEITTLRQRQLAELEAVKHASRLKRAVIKQVRGNRLAKKVLYALVGRALKAELAKVCEQHRRQQHWLRHRYARRVWVDWLKASAMQGDVAALEALRARSSSQGLQGNAITGSDLQVAVRALPAKPECVTGKGTVVYRVGDAAIRDDGARLQISRGADRDGIDAAIRMAIERYGNRISVAGSDPFKSRVVAAAAQSALPVTFADAVLERRRQALVVTTSGDTHDDQDRRRSTPKNDGVAEFGATGRRRGQRTVVHAHGGLHRSARGPGRASPVRGGERGQSDVGRVGSEPSPQGRNRLRDLSELGVVQLAKGGEVLLPRDVPRHLEQPDAPPDHPLRRPLPGSGCIAEGNAAAEKLIAEREQKRARGFDIPKYFRYTAGMKLVVTYAGTRSSDGRFLALLRRGDQIEVLPIDSATARRLKRVRIGDPVTVTDQGRIQTKARSR